MTNTTRKTLPASFAVFALLFTAIGWAGITPAQPGTCYATTGSGGSAPASLLTVDISTGEAEFVGASGERQLPGLAIDSAGQMFTTDDSNLYAIDAATGATTLIGSFGGSVFVEGLAFDSSDTLWGVDALLALVTINTTTAQITVVGNHGVFNIIGLAFDPSGRLYGSVGGNAASPGDIYQFNTSDGSVSLVGNAGLGRPVSDLHFFDGQMYGVAGGGGSQGIPFDLITVNLGSGAATIVGPTGFSSVSSLDGDCVFSHASIPTLNIYGILALMLILMLGATVTLRAHRRRAGNQ